MFPVARATRLVLAVTMVAVALLPAIGCKKEPAAPALPPKPPALTGLPIELSVKQRSTTDVPGAARALRLTIDDVTGGQVLASLVDAQGRAVLAPKSMALGDAAAFQHGDEQYFLTLKELDNELIGDDSAVFVIQAAEKSRGADDPDNPPADLAEREKIERLIAAIESAEGAVFIRNGEEYSSRDAAEHLRTKWKAAGDVTADQFIEGIASKSSTSGEPYQIRLPDGKTVAAADFLRRRLKEIEDER